MRFSLLSICLTFGAALPVFAQSVDTSGAMAGISNHGRNGNQPYVTAGDRAYLIGTEDGNFPAMGDHVPGEMAGLWMHPIKLMDGFRASIHDVETGRTAPLAKASELITYPYGTRLRYPEVLNGLRVERFQFSPDGQPGVVIQYMLANTTDRPVRLRLEFTAEPDLRPVWYSEHIGIRDAPDSVTWSRSRGVFIAKDSGNPWFCVWGPGPSAHLMSVAPHDSSTLTLVIAGSDRSEAAALETFDRLVRDHAPLLAATIARYRSLLGRARIEIPDARLQQVYDWVKVDAQWLAREVPGIGRGLSAGLMEYPWWFGTETYSLRSLAASGDVSLAKETLRLLRRQSDKTNGNGRIVHEVTTNGGISNPGNTQETAQFIMTVGTVIDWSGDTAFAREMYPAMTQSLHWLLTDMDRNHDMFPEGYGIMEVSGLNAELIDVAVYTQAALEATARVAGILGENKDADRYRRMGDALKAKINAQFWSERDTSYADFYGTRSQAMSAADGAIRQIGLKGADKLTAEDRALIERYRTMRAGFARLPDTSRGWLTNRNWVVTTPMETGIAPPERAIPALDKIRRDAGAHGPYLSAFERQAMMTISTGVQAVSEGNYGRTENALWYMNRIAETFGQVSPGTISEMMPDYGCFVIAWTMYGIVVPLIDHIFGIHPDAVHRTIVIEPHIPAGWNNMRIDNLPIGSNRISFFMMKVGGVTRFGVDATDDHWTYILKLPPGGSYYLNGRGVASDSIRMTGRSNRVEVRRPSAQPSSDRSPR